MQLGLRRATAAVFCACATARPDRPRPFPEAERRKEGWELRGQDKKRKRWSQLTRSRDSLGGGNAGVLEGGARNLSEDGCLQSEPLRGTGKKRSGPGKQRRCSTRNPQLRSYAAPGA